MAGNQVQDNNTGSMLPGTSSDERAESRSTELWPKHLVVNTNEANQPNSNIPTISRDAECRDDSNRLISTLPPYQNPTNVGERPIFCTNTWGPHKPGQTFSEFSTFLEP
ncbi:hypothetical protein FXO37_04014 [Capsicum annuum]|nr:hypothetical protein FXO37_04014 [Capsicum annuum]